MYSLAPVHRRWPRCTRRSSRSRGRIGDGAGDLESIDAGRCRLRSHTDTLEWLAFALLRLGCEFEVHEPPELREHLRLLAGRLMRAAG